MKLTKHRSRKPIIENGSGNAAVSYQGGERSYTIDCRGPWTYSKGHECSYTLHLSKMEMLQAMESWLATLVRDERDALKASVPPPNCAKGTFNPLDARFSLADDDDNLLSRPPTHTGKLAAPVTQANLSPAYRDPGAEQRAHLQDAERIPDAVPLTTEEFDLAQFGRSLHARPEPK